MKTLFLYIGPARAHKKMAESLGAKFRYAYPWGGLRILKPIKLFIYILSMPKDYDIYLCEGSSYLFPALLKMFHMLKVNSKIVMIAADPLFHYLRNGIINIKSMPTLLLYKILFKYIDDFICVSKSVEEDVKYVVPHGNTIVIYPLVETAKKILFKRYSNKLPNLNSKNIVFVGRPDIYYKGIDILITSFLKIKRIYPDSKLILVGNFYKETILEYEQKAAIKMPVCTVKKILDAINNKRNDIIILNNLSDINLLKTFKMASIYLHLGRGDAFPLSVEEAMLAGLPAIVSDQTGSKELVEAIGKNFVVPMQQEKIVKAVTDYFSSSYKRKIFLSKKAISASQKFSLKSEAIFNKKFKVSSLGKKDF